VCIILESYWNCETELESRDSEAKLHTWTPRLRGPATSPRSCASFPQGVSPARF
jgi:hypothetical protein